MNDHTITITLNEKQYKLLLEYTEDINQGFRDIFRGTPESWASALLSVRLDQWAESRAALDALDARKAA